LIRRPDAKVGHDAFAVIRETIRNMDKVAVGRVVLTSREHIIGLEPIGKGLMGMLLRYPHEVRDEHEYFDDIENVKVTKDMAKHIVQSEVRRLRAQEVRGPSRGCPDRADQSEARRQDYSTKAAAEGRERRRSDGRAEDSLHSDHCAPHPAAKSKRPRKASAGQKEMLLAIGGKPAARNAPKRLTSARPPTRLDRGCCPLKFARTGRLSAHIAKPMPAAMAGTPEMTRSPHSTSSRSA
jgi:DNA end-binding protein Ku